MPWGCGRRESSLSSCWVSALLKSRGAHEVPQGYDGARKAAGPYGSDQTAPWRQPARPTPSTLARTSAPRILVRVPIDEIVGVVVNGRNKRNRMDRRHLEPGERLHEGVRRVQ